VIVESLRPHLALPRARLNRPDMVVQTTKYTDGVRKLVSLAEGAAPLASSAVTLLGPSD
jgi:hypothetical protein